MLVSDILQMLSLGSLSFISFGTFVKSSSQSLGDPLKLGVRCEGKSLTFADIFVIFVFVLRGFQQISPSCCDTAGKAGREEILTFHDLTGRKEDKFSKNCFYVDFRKNKTL